MDKRILAGALLAGLITAQGVAAAEVKVLTAGAMKQVVLAVVPQFEQQTGHKVTVSNDTAGVLQKRIDGGEAFDLAIITPAVVDDLITKGKIATPRTDLARVGVGVAVKSGTPAPDISTVEAFKRAVLAAKSVAYIDPASGGSSGIYVAKLLERLGIADQVKGKAVLVPGGLVAERVVKGEAELGIHQISEIVPVAGATLVGPLPADIQNYTTYSAGVGTAAKEAEAAKALINLMTGPGATQMLKSKGMDQPTS